MARKDWLKETPLESLDPKKRYFICRTWQWGGPDDKSNTSTEFYAEWGNGKVAWSHKPGIAVRVVGNDSLRAFIAKLQDRQEGRMRIIAVEVPADADKRWRARTALGGGFKRRRIR